MNSSKPKQSLKEGIVIIKGKPPLQQPYYGAGAERYLTPEYLRGNDDAEFVKPCLNAVHVKDDETIVLWDGSNAGEIFRAKNGILASTMAVVRHNDEFDSGYFNYSLKNWENFLKAQTSGSGIPHVDKEIFANLSLISFSRPEQAKIAEVLSTVDQAIEDTEALIAKQQRIKTGLMQDLLTRGIDENGDLRSEKTHKFKESAIGRIPIEWEATPIGESISFIIDYRGKTPPHSNDGVAVISAESIGEDRVRQITKYVTKDVYEKWTTRGLPEPGDVIFTTEAPVGEVACLPGDQTYLLTRRVIALRPQTDILRKQYLFYSLKSAKQRGVWEMFTAGTTAPRIKRPDVTNLRIPLPSAAEQDRILLILAEQWQYVEDTVQAKKKLKALKTGLMQDLLKGKVRVTELLENKT
ncbi:EcoKI restriction-modification system protein HsdS [Anaerohalosphaera lusitana]|uniref:EcoKI restriction-modification system protein HsdS n=1 Tax=Anaerohalosphaera lusitana TaxID=1936003 RepID=A0A1U9NJB9_9BACT|nr:restriction endonuclease subunit S [Anaerohalosphaera lusitana]AQT67915.1 EcoKI restriction-modification system protein HsdS [Anaerohalosphaera lusitana]